MEDEVRVFLSSPQSFEPVDQKGNFKNNIIRKKKRKTRSRKLLIRNILIEEDFSKLTVRQQILNTKFRTTVKSSNDISLINSGIDLVEYNINNKNNLENYLKGTKKDTMEGNMAINRPSRKKRKLEEDVVLGHKYYKTLYEDSLKSPKSVNKRLLKIKLNKIESDTEKIFFLRLPVINETPEKENKYILRLPLSEEKEILPVLCLKLPVYRKKNKITKWIWLPKPTVETRTIRKECYIPKGPFALYGEIISTIPALLYEEESKILPLESLIDCITDVHDHKEIRNCLVKFTLYIEIIQEYLKFHHCELVDSLLKHLKIILERINDCKCMCEIEKELIDVFQRIEDCKDCIR